MKKVVTIGDIHGQSVWKEFLFGTLSSFEAWKERVLNDEKPTWENALSIVFSDIDKVVFVGDYFDSFTVSNVEMKHNFLDICLFKRQYPERVFLLWGNHDVQYWNSEYKCPGFRSEMYYDFNEIIRSNNQLLDFAHQDGNVLWTHAGVTGKFYTLCQLKAIETDRFGEIWKENLTKENLGEFLNEMWLYQWKPLFAVGHGRGGHSPFPSPLWADRWELTEDFPTDLHQFVGHTPVEQFCGTYTDTESVNFLDCLGPKTVIQSVIIVNLEEEKYSGYEIYENPNAPVWEPKNF